MHACPECGREWDSHLAAVECCDDSWAADAHKHRHR